MLRVQEFQHDDFPPESLLANRLVDDGLEGNNLENSEQS